MALVLKTYFELFVTVSDAATKIFLRQTKYDQNQK